MYGICMDYVVEYAWNMHGICMEDAWQMRGICIDYAWNMHGICMEYALNPSTPLGSRRVRPHRDRVYPIPLTPFPLDPHPAEWRNTQKNTCVSNKPCILLGAEGVPNVQPVRIPYFGPKRPGLLAFKQKRS